MRRHFIAFMSVLLAWIPISDAAEIKRGLSVPLRAGLDSNAGISQKFQLYRGSKALVIGIDDYTNGWPKLSMAVEDARQIAAALKKQGFDVTLKTDLTAVGLQSALESFFVVEGADPDARLFVWYAGHGHTLGGEGYLVPTDAPRPDQKSAFKLKALPMRSLGTYVRLAEAKHAFAVFDSCFSGTIFDAQRALPPTAITYATTRPVRQFLTSGDADQTVSDNGAFRELFLRALNGEETADANRDGFLTASELGLFMNDRVTNLTDARQTPRYGKLSDRRFDRGDFVFALANPGLAPKPKSAPDQISPELVFWRSIEDSEDPAMYKAYLNRFPTGAFVAIARVRQKKLLDALSKSVIAPKSASRRTRRSAPEDVTWSSIKFSDDPEDFEVYLERYPDGKYALDARKKLKNFKK